MNDKFKKILKNIPLETRVRVSIQAHFIAENGGSLFLPIDENGNEDQDVIKANKVCLDKAQPLIDIILNDIKKWKEDGCP